MLIVVVLALIGYIIYEEISSSRSAKTRELWDAHLATAPDPAYTEMEKLADPIDIYDVGYIDENGNWIIEPAYTRTYPFRHNRRRVCAGEKYGYESTDGNVTVKPQYDWAADYWNGYAMVGKEHYLSKLYGKSGIWLFVPIPIKRQYRHWIIDENGNRVNSDALR